MTETYPYPPKRLRAGGGTITNPAVYVCPRCGAEMREGWDEASDGSIHGDGWYICSNHHLLPGNGQLIEMNEDDG